MASPIKISKAIEHFVDFLRQYFLMFPYKMFSFHENSVGSGRKCVFLAFNDLMFKHIIVSNFTKTHIPVDNKYEYDVYVESDFFDSSTSRPCKFN